MSRWERDRTEREEAFGDACYDVWMSGGDPDMVDRDAISEAWYQCYNCEETANIVSRDVLGRK